MTRGRTLVAGTAMAVLIASAGTQAQQAVLREFVDLVSFAPHDSQQFEIVAAEPLGSEVVVKGAPFSAEAVNEFVQVLGDGNRIERRFTTSLWRDSQGRTRREQQIALVGPLSVSGEPPRLVTITDPVIETSFTLDELHKSAFPNGMSMHVAAKRVTITKDEGSANAQENVFVFHDGAAVIAGGIAGAGVGGHQVVGGQFFDVGTPKENVVKVEKLGMRQIEGLAAEGTRTTMVIPAGAVGNIAPIEVVSEEWFSKELQTALVITRRDPRSGDTSYRLMNISRAEPPEYLFKVPDDYQIIAPHHQPPPPPPPPPPPARGE